MPVLTGLGRPLPTNGSVSVPLGVAAEVLERHLRALDANVAEQVHEASRSAVPPSSAWQIFCLADLTCIFLEIILSFAFCDVSMFS